MGDVRKVRWTRHSALTNLLDHIEIILVADIFQNLLLIAKNDESTTAFNLEQMNV